MLKYYCIPFILCLQNGFAATPLSFSQGLQQGNFDQAVRLALKQPQHPLKRLIETAKKNKLASKPLWIALLHYHKKDLGWQSQVDSPWFFLSAQGKNNPEKELEATLAAFFSTRIKKPMRLTPWCRFVARRQWLLKNLGTTAKLLPSRDCPEFTRYKRFFNADSLTVIFPSTHPNGPSSAFGHTLLRLDKRQQNKALNLLNQSINFAAEIPENINPFSYVSGGLSGKLQGKFHILPYHIKLREYGQVDNRDIWEYTLELSQDQVDIILYHSYEMLIAYFDYYFFRENCSYHLLSLLDVAFPNDRLTELFSYWVIPVDTLKVLEQRHLIRERHYVGSLAKKIKQQHLTLKKNSLLIAEQLMHHLAYSDVSQLQKLALPEQAKILDLASDYHRYRRLSGGGKINKLSPGEKKLLSLRSKIALSTQEVILKQAGISPEKGHGTARISLAYTQTKTEKQMQLQWRPAYHDFLDPEPGYTDNSAIDFLSVTLARTQTAEHFIKEFILLDIQSAEPRDQFFKPISWRTRIAWDKADSKTATRFTLLGGAGVAYQKIKKHPLTYLFSEISLIHHRELKTQTTLAGKIRSGFLWSPNAHLRLRKEISYQRDAFNSRDIWQAKFDLGVAIDSSFSITLETQATGEQFNHLEFSSTVSFRFYF